MPSSQKSISQDDKLKLLEKFDSLPKMSKEKAANELKIPRTTLNNILRDRKNINCGARKRNLSGQSPQVDMRLALKTLKKGLQSCKNFDINKLLKFESEVKKHCKPP